MDVAFTDLIVSSQPRLNISDSKIENFKNQLSKELKHICIGISASGPTKRWAIENYIKLCKKIFNPIYYYRYENENF